MVPTGIAAGHSGGRPAGWRACDRTRGRCASSAEHARDGCAYADRIVELLPRLLRKPRRARADADYLSRTVELGNASTCRFSALCECARWRAALVSRRRCPRLSRAMPSRVGGSLPTRRWRDARRPARPPVRRGTRVRLAPEADDAIARASSRRAARRRAVSRARRADGRRAGARRGRAGHGRGVRQPGDARADGVPRQEARRSLRVAH